MAETGARGGALCRGALRLLFDHLVQLTRAVARDTVLDFDHRHGVETRRAAAEVALGPGHVAPDGRDFYEATTVRHFRHVMRFVPRPLEQWSFWDVGSGKGRVVFLAIAWPFRRVEGVEYLPELHATAEANLERYQGPRVAGDVALACGDALEVTLPAGDLVVFFYNSMHGALLEALLDRLEHAVAESRRHLLFIYSNPVERFRLDRRPAFQLIREGTSPYDLVWWGNRRFVIYALGDPDLDQRA